MTERISSFGIQDGGRTTTVRVIVSPTPEELLEWMSRAEMYYTLTGDVNTMEPISRDIKDQLIKPNVGS